MGISTNRTTSTGSKSNGVTHRHVQRSTNGKMAASFDSSRSTVYSAGNKHVTTVRATNSVSKLKALPKMTTRVTGNSSLKSPKSPRSSSRSRSSRSSKSQGDGGVTLLFGLFVALIAGIGWLFSWMFGSSKESESE